MRKSVIITLFLAAFFLFSGTSQAQVPNNAIVVATCGNITPNLPTDRTRYLTVNQEGALCIDGSSIVINLGTGNSFSVASVGTIGSTAPTSADFTGGKVGTLLRGITATTWGGTGTALDVFLGNTSVAITAASASFASGALSDGAVVTIGAKTDNKSTATDTTSISVVSILKEISAMEQAPASRAVTNAGTFAVQVSSAIPAGSNVIGHIIADTGSTTAVTQPTGTNLHVVTDTTSTTAITQATASNLNAQVVGNVASTNSDSGNPVKVGGVYNTSPPSLTTANRSDLQQDAKGNLRNVIMDAAGNTRGVNVNSSNQLSVSVDNVVSLSSGSNNIGTVGNTQGSSTSGQSGPLVQGAVTTSAPSYTNTQTSPLSLDLTGALRVSVVSGSTGNAAAGATGSAVPAQAGYTGGREVSTGLLRGITATATSGTSYALDVNVAGGSAANGAASNTGSAVPTQADYNGLNIGGTLRGRTGVNPTGSVYAAQTDITSINGVTANTAQVGATTLNTALTALVIDSVMYYGDGTRVLSTDTVPIVGPAADGVAVSGNPIRIAGKDAGGLTQDLVSGSDGVLVVAQGTTAFTVTATNLSTNIAQMNGTTVTMGNGVSGTGVQRVTIASDSTGIIALTTGSSQIGHLEANQSVNTAQMNGVAVTMGNGVSGTGVQRVTIASDSTGTVALAAGTTVNANFLTSNIGANVAQINGVAPSMGNGASGTGVQRVTIANDSTGIIALTTGSSQIGHLEANQSTNVTQWNGTTVVTGSGNATGALRVEVANNGTGLITTNPATAANWGIYVEDAAETAGGNLMMAGSVRRDTPASSAGSSGDNSTLNTDSTGYLYTHGISVVTTGQSAATGPELIGSVDGNGNQQPDIMCGSTVVFDGTTSGSTQIVALSGSTHVYICGYEMMAAGTVNVALVAGTGTNCASAASGANNVTYNGSASTGANAKLTPVWQLTTQVGKVSPYPTHGYLIDAGSGNAVCVNLSTGVQTEVQVWYQRR